MADLNRIYGIDLGTTYSCIAVVDETDKAQIIRNDEGDSTTPSVVFFDKDKVIVGKEAKRHAALYPDRVAQMVKRSMGDPTFLFECDGRTYRPEEISAFVLRKVVADAEKETGDRITDVVITCPAYFGISQREATASAGKIAGLNVRSIINEPTAAAISYGLETEQDQVVLVYDLGGGTFDITMIECVTGGVTVLCVGGNHCLGGEDWDTALVKYLAERFQDETGCANDICSNNETLQEMLNDVEEAKRTLSQREETLLKVRHEGESARVKMTRQKFDELTESLLEETISLTKQMIDEAAQMGFHRFDKILLVGGSTRMPQVLRRVQEEFNVSCELYDPDQAVARGAARFGWKLALDDEIKISISEQTGQSWEDVDIAAAGSATIQQAQEEVARKFDLRLPAVRKAVETTVANVTSKTFGVVAITDEHREVVVNLIRRNSPVPADVSREFGTLEENQHSVEVRLMEGLEASDHSELAQCSEIGTALLELPPGLQAGAPIEVNFKLNEQGRLVVHAKEPRSGNVVDIDVQTESVMSAAEIEEAKKRGLAVTVS